jgi:hypothetical protein
LDLLEVAIRDADLEHFPRVIDARHDEVNVLGIPGPFRPAKQSFRLRARSSYGSSNRKG